MLSHNQKEFLALVRAGLWEKECQLLPFNNIDFSEIYRLAQEQTVIGLVAAGLEHVIDIKLPKEDVLTFVVETLQLEKRNTLMNSFIEELVANMRNADIYALLIKGQGIAQCYERPLWRACGDVDFFLSESNYQAAKNYLIPHAAHVEEEKTHSKHLALAIESWVVELHGTLRGGMWGKVDRVLNEVQNEISYSGAVRTWIDGQTNVFLPHANEDVVFVFTHILQHFFRGGIGLRQICDWCRLIYTFRENINEGLLESRIKKMGLMTEWKTFSALAISTLGMPADAIPFYSSDKKWGKKALYVLNIIFETGNFGRKRDKGYYKKYPYFIYKVLSLWQNTKDTAKQFRIFPIDSIRIWNLMIRDGIIAVFKGK